MTNFTKKFGFVIAFLIGTALVQMTFGEKVTFYFLLLVLFSMLINNSDKFSNLLGGVSNG
jgi:hypothetical protein